MAKSIKNAPLNIAPGIYAESIHNITDKYGELEGKLNINALDTKIKIYERQVKGWFLDPAKELIEISKRDITSSKFYFIILMIGISYIEGIQQYIEGNCSNGFNRVFFVKGFKEVFNNMLSETQIKRLYKDARCGLFHNGMVGKNTLVNFEGDKIFKLKEKTVIVYVDKFIEKIEKHFNEYISKLKHDEDLKRNFDKMFNVE